MAKFTDVNDEGTLYLNLYIDAIGQSNVAWRVTVNSPVGHYTYGKAGASRITVTVDGVEVNKSYPSWSTSGEEFTLASGTATADKNGYGSAGTGIVLLALFEPRNGVDGTMFVNGRLTLQEVQKPSAYKWAGAMALYTLPVDSKGDIITARNFRCDFNVKFWENDVGQTGRITVGFLDKNDQLICAYDIAKDDQNGEETKVNFYTGKDDIIVTQTFGANNNEKNKSKPNIAFNNKAGNVSVIKEGSKITFTYGDKPFSFNVSKLDKKECAKIYISAGALFAARNINKLVYLMTVESIAFSNNNSQRYDSLPNRYREDTKLVIDLHEGEIWLHNNTSSQLGQRAQSELVHGSRYFAVPKGTSYLKVYPSPWSESLPDVELEWKDSWL